LIRPEALAASDGSLADVQSRFEREAQATAALRSPHSIILYDFGVTQRGMFYYVMELLDGCDLQSLVERFGSISVGRTVHILRQVCHSLLDAHGNGLIHRDIKPSNIFLCRYGHDVDFVKILDFGLVKSLQPLHTTDEILTAQNALLGTPAYIAPEVIYAGQDIDARADLYSVGCVAFWLLVGRPVFVGDSVGEVLRQHLHDDPPPPSRCSELEIPASLDQIVLDCLRKRPDDRISTVADLLDRLDRLEMDPAWTPARAARWWEVHLPSGRADPDETPGFGPLVDRVVVHPDTETLRKAPRERGEDKPRP
jgi:serine/threonine-protein kinase